MDNDNKIKKMLSGTYRSAKMKLNYFGMNLCNEQNGNDLIAALLSKDSSFMVGRLGAVEMHCVSRWMNHQCCTDKELEQANVAAGIFPKSHDIIENFCRVYSDSLRICDVLGVWGVTDEKKAIMKYCNKNVSLIPSRSIEPYYFENPWSHHMKGKKVLVIHPFVDSIRKQVQNKDLIWNGKQIIPDDVEFEYIKAIQSNAGALSGFDDWFQALQYMKDEIDRHRFDLAIIGAGAYGIPLAAYVKSKGKQSIQMAGATQILFGIKGNRWDNHPIISKFYTDAWIRPSGEETPPGIEKVEGGSYW